MTRSDLDNELAELDGVAVMGVVWDRALHRQRKGNGHA